jgi:hypothetical protein
MGPSRAEEFERPLLMADQKNSRFFLTIDCAAVGTVFDSQNRQIEWFFRCRSKNIRVK